MAELEQLDTLTYELRAGLKRDVRVLGLWLEGSLGRRTDADRHSDIDFHILVAPKSEARFRADLPQLIAAVREPLFYRPLNFGTMGAMVLFAGLLHLEIWVETQARRLPQRQTRILYNPNGLLENATVALPDTVSLPDQLAERLGDFWFGVSGLPKLERGDLLPAALHLGRQVEYAADIVRLGDGQTRTVGESRLSLYLTPGQEAELKAVLVLPDVTALSLARAHLQLADFVSQHGRTAAAHQGIGYPEHVERDVLKNVQTALGRLDLAP